MTTVQAETDHHRLLLREMLRIRRFEEKCAELYSAGKIRGFLHLYTGEEAVAVGVMQGLGADDAIVATYREHGHALEPGGGIRKRGFCKGNRISYKSQRITEGTRQLLVLWNGDVWIWKSLSCAQRV